MRNPIVFTIALLFAVTAVRAQTLPDTGAFAIVDVRVEVGDGRTLDHATILLRDGLIQAVGPNLKVPPDAEVIKGAGLVAYPGFIDAGCSRGLKLPDWQPDQDRVPDTTSLAPASMRAANRKWIRPELRARDCLALTDAILGPMRKNGFCSALFTPAGGLITGVSAFANLNGVPRREALVRGNVGLCMSFNPSDGAEAGPPGPRQAGAGGTGYPGSLLGIIAHIRQALLDGDRNRELMPLYERTGGVRPPFDDSLEALQPALTGKMPVIFNADSRNEIDRALRLADEFHLKVILAGGGDAWKVGPLLNKRGVPVLASVNFGDEPGVVKPPSAPSAGTRRPGRRGAPADPPAPTDDPQTTNPAIPGASAVEVKDEDDTPKAVTADEHRKWEERVSCAALLEKAGVPFAFSGSGLKNQGDFLKNVRRAITAGLPKLAALRALTINPAKILGVDRQLGTIEPGKMANIVLMTADFTEPGALVKYLVIEKTRFEPGAETAPTPIPPAAVPADDDEIENSWEQSR